jgi:anthranilate phosphoribosyltransferase
MHAYYAAHPASVLLMRGTEGEAVVRTARPQAIEWLHDSRAETVLAADDRDTDERALGLPDPFDVSGTARWIEEAATGARPVPVPITAQVAAMVRIANIRSPS